MIRRIITLSLLAILCSSCTGVSEWYRAAPRWCTGVCEVYAAQIEIAKEDAKPWADRQAMRVAEDKAWDTLRRNDLSQIYHDVEELRCAAGLGDRAYRAENCTASK